MSRKRRRVSEPARARDEARPQLIYKDVCIICLESTKTDRKNKGRYAYSLSLMNYYKLINKILHGKSTIG